MRTGRYRLRRGLFGRSVMQCEYSTPSLIGGQVASDVRQYIWADVMYDELSNIAVRFIDLSYNCSIAGRNS